MNDNIDPRFRMEIVIKELWRYLNAVEKNNVMTPRRIAARKRNAKVMVQKRMAARAKRIAAGLPAKKTKRNVKNPEKWD